MGSAITIFIACQKSVQKSKIPELMHALLKYVEPTTYRAAEGTDGKSRKYNYKNMMDADPEIEIKEGRFEHGGVRLIRENLKDGKEVYNERKREERI